MCPRVYDDFTLSDRRLPGPRAHEPTGRNGWKEGASITMYRIQNGTGTLPPTVITSTDDLVTVFFRARKATSGTPIEIPPESVACDLIGALPGQPSDCTPELSVTWSGGIVTAYYQSLVP